MKSALSIEMAAEPGVVFGLARDVERWATLLPHYRRSQRLATNGDGSLLVQFVALRPIGPMDAYGLPVVWRARTWNDASTCELRFLHLGGATAGMDVTWRIEPLGEGSRVTIEHDFAAPADWAAFIDRWFTRPIASRTLATFGALAAAVQSASPISTNRPT